MDQAATPTLEQRARQDFPLSEVPPQARKSLLSLTVVLLGFTFFTATMFGGGRIGPAFAFDELLGVIAVGNLLLGVYVATLGWMASRSGLNTALMSRYGFGSVGSRWPDLLLGLTQMGWYGWGTATIAVLTLRFAGVAESDPSYTLFLYGLMAVFGLAFCWTAYVGYRGLEVLSLVAVPAMVLLLGVSLTRTLETAEAQGGLLASEPTATLGWGAAITIVFGTFVSGGTQATNWTRFARTGTSAIVASLLAFFIGNGLMVLTGALGALVYQQPDVVDVLVLQGLVTLGVIMLFLNIWTTQDNTIYNFSAVGAHFFRTRNRRLVTVGGAVLGTALAFLRIDLYLVPYLLLLGTFIPPVGGVIIADFFFRHRGEYSPLASTQFQAFNWAGIGAYVIACFVAYYSPGIPPVNGIIAAVVAYIALDRILAAFGVAATETP